MGTIKDEANAYEPHTTKNISELDIVPTDLTVEDDEFETEDQKTGEPKIVKQKVFKHLGEKYRIPFSVLKQLKDILQDYPDLKKFKVRKSGTGLNTEYTVIPLIDAK